MVSLLPPRGSSSSRSSGRGDDDVQLTATVPTEQEPDDEPREPAGVRYGWQLVVVGGAVAAALAGWIIVAGLAVVGWLAAEPGELTDALQVGTRLWLLANGTPVDLAGLRWSLTPLGMSLLIAFMVSRFARAAARFAAPESGRDAARVCAMTIGLTTVSYAGAVAVVGLGTGSELTRGVIGAALLAAVGSSWGAVRGLGVTVVDRLPAWARSLPYAVAAAVGVLLLGGIAVLGTGIVLHADRIGGLTAALGAGAVGGIALWAGQAFFLPNAIVWCSSYAVGAGFRLGQGSVVAPAEVSLGLMPGIPILGALPRNGPGDHWSMLWLLTGAAAGAVAALVVVRRRSEARFDETALVGGLSGVLAAIVFTGLAWTTGGDLGDGRLSGAGVRLPELLVMSVTLLGLAGMISGLIFGLLAPVVRRRAGARDVQITPLIAPAAPTDAADAAGDSDEGTATADEDSAAPEQLSAPEDEADPDDDSPPADAAGADPDEEETTELATDTASTHD